MSDFRDDFSPIPIAPQLESEEVLDEIDIQEDKQVADAAYSGAWGKVEEMFVNEIARLRDVSSVDQNLVSDEFAIECKSNLKAAGVISAIWGKVKDAVEAVESIERTTKGGK